MYAMMQCASRPTLAVTVQESCGRMDVTGFDWSKFCPSLNRGARSSESRCLMVPLLHRLTPAMFQYYIPLPI